MTITDDPHFAPVNMTDHEMARLLRRHDAIDTSKRYGNATMWFTPENKVVVIIFYQGMETTQYARRELLPVGSA